MCALNGGFSKAVRNWPPSTRRNGKDKVDGEARTRVTHTCTSRRVGERLLRKGKDGGDMVREGGLKLDGRKCPLSPSGVQCTLPNSHFAPLFLFIYFFLRKFSIDYS
jgi:hypothetical protein